MSMTPGQALRHLRIASYLSLDQVARVAGVSPARLERVEEGEPAPSPAWLGAVSAAITWLISPPEPAEPHPEVFANLDDVIRYIYPAIEDTEPGFDVERFAQALTEWHTGYDDAGRARDELSGLVIRPEYRGDDGLNMAFAALLAEYDARAQD